MLERLGRTRRLRLLVASAALLVALAAMVVVLATLGGGGADKAPAATSAPEPTSNPTVTPTATPQASPERINMGEAFIIDGVRTPGAVGVIPNVRVPWSAPVNVTRLGATNPPSGQIGLRR